MLDLLTIALEAHCDERNHHRRYEVAVGRDLFEHWVVTIRYGRVGGPLREHRMGGLDVEKARAVLETCLRRRLAAPKRIGCSYTIRQFNTVDGVHVAEWVSRSVIAALI